MTAETRTLTRDDLDIRDDIYTLIVKYPPTNADRNHIHIEVRQGVVRLSGYVKTPISRRYLQDRIPHIPGVVDLNLDDLHDDESIRLEAGKVLPYGPIINVSYGTIILTGRLPEGTSADALIDALGKVPGVQRVVARI